MNVKEIKKEISKLSSLEILEVLHECVDLVDAKEPSEMAEFVGKSKKQIHNRISDEKYLCFEFIGRKFPIVNDHLKNRM